MNELRLDELRDILRYSLGNSIVDIVSASLYKQENDFIAHKLIEEIIDVAVTIKDEV